MAKGAFWGLPVVVTFLPGALLVASASAATIEGPPPRFSQYAVFEAELGGAEAWLGVPEDAHATRDVLFESPDGSQQRVAAFWNGPLHEPSSGRGSLPDAAGGSWTVRYLPDRIGPWRYFLIDEEGAEKELGRFDCVETGAGRGVLTAFTDQPRWFADASGRPVWIRSYLFTGIDPAEVELGAVEKTVYQPLLERGYNHFLFAAAQPFERGEDAGSSQRWRRLEQHLAWMASRGVYAGWTEGLLGGEGRQAAWEAAAPEQRDRWVRHLVARLGVYPSIGCWNVGRKLYAETEDDAADLAKRLAALDASHRLVTYLDEYPRRNEYFRDFYGMGLIGSRLIAAPSEDLDRSFWRSALVYHLAAQLAFEGKPVIVADGTALLRQPWESVVGASPRECIRAAWGCVLGGASFSWNGHGAGYLAGPMEPYGLPIAQRSPFRGVDRAFQAMSDLLTRFLFFAPMAPAPALLSDHEATRVFCMAEAGRQYLVFAEDGQPFSLQMESGTYAAAIWMDAVSGKRQSLGAIVVERPGDFVRMTPPDDQSDWVLAIRR